MEELDQIRDDSTRRRQLWLDCKEGYGEDHPITAVARNLFLSARQRADAAVKVWITQLH
jgi:hypothetical protein